MSRLGTHNAISSVDTSLIGVQGVGNINWSLVQYHSLFRCDVALNGPFISPPMAGVGMWFVLAQ